MVQTTTTTPHGSARHCDDCGHTGDEGGSTTESHCGACGTTVPYPKEDKCQECGATNCMLIACPKCGGRYWEHEQPEGVRKVTMVEPVDPDRIDVLCGKPGDKDRYIRSDQLIRSGMCPNGHGLMTVGGWGQECPQCGFTCNTLPELREH